MTRYGLVCPTCKRDLEGYSHNDHRPGTYTMWPCGHVTNQPAELPEDQ